MAATPKRKTPTRPAARLVERTPGLEWMAAAVGLILTLAVLGVTVWELLADDGGPPVLIAEMRPARSSAGPWTTPIKVRNASFATAADVEVEGIQLVQGREEIRSVVLPYVPARGEAIGAMVFPQDPARYPVALSVMAYRDP